MMRSYFISSVLMPLVLCSLTVFPAYGQSTQKTKEEQDAAERNKNIAVDFFDRGVKLMNKGHCDKIPVSAPEPCKEARELFRRAIELYPEGLGAYRNIAEIEVALAMYASAARHYREVVRRAPLDAKPARRLWGALAQKELKKLEPKVPKLLVKVPNRDPNLTMTLDGIPLPEAGWEVTVDVDPGAHVLKASAPGHNSFEESFEAVSGETKSIEVNIFKPRDPSSPETSTSTSSGLSVVPSKKKRWVAPVILGATGLLITGVGLTFGGLAISKKKEACGDSPSCEPNGLSTARTLATVSTIGTIVGLAAVVGGVTWLILSKEKSPSKAGAMLAPWASTREGGLSVIGRF